MPKQPTHSRIYMRLGDYCYRCGAKTHLEADCPLNLVPQSQTGERRKAWQSRKDR
jgi:hypothetical protein